MVLLVIWRAGPSSQVWWLYPSG